MRSYITDAGLSLMQSAIAQLPTPSVSLSGMQVGSRVGFMPDNSMMTAQDIVLDKRNDASSVKTTLVNVQECIFTTILDRDIELSAVGNVLFFANNVPLLWLIGDYFFGKLKTNPISHFAGDKCYLSVVFRFPYIENIMVINNANTLHAKFPVFNTIKDLTVPQHTLADQAVVEDNNLFYGNNSPFLAFQHRDGWRSLPTMKPLNNPRLFAIEGGTTKAGM